MAAALIDPTVTGNYPVVLGARLAGKDPTEIFTSIRYNHKPTLSSPSAPDQARLKPATAGQTSSYDLSFHDGNGSYAYSGARTVDKSQHVLYFDPKLKAFVLDKVDSTFNLNLARTPSNGDPESLRREFAPIEDAPPPAPAPAAATTKAKQAAAPAPAAKPKTTKAAANKAKNVFAKAPPKSKAKGSAAAATSKKDAPKKAPSAPLALPTPVAPEDTKPAASTKPRKARDEEDEDEEDEDDDDGLVMEFPGAEQAKSHARNPAPAFTAIKKFDEYMDQRESAAEEGDEESEEDEGEFEDVGGARQAGVAHGTVDDAMDVDPVEGQGPAGQEEEVVVEEEEEEDPLAGLEDDLEKDLENAFEDLENSQNGSPDGDESDISEEE